jgi:hypothetical protein
VDISAWLHAVSRRPSGAREVAAQKGLKLPVLIEWFTEGTEAGT